MNQGTYGTAEGLQREALSIMATVYGTAHVEVTYCTAILADLLMDMVQY